MLLHLLLFLLYRTSVPPHGFQEMALTQNIIIFLTILLTYFNKGQHTVIHNARKFIILMPLCKSLTPLMAAQAVKLKTLPLANVRLPIVVKA
ncbi:hypothetical protein DDN64_11565 [Vibrio cholerae]|nr:hypothetical protein [Vibrio cholerae]